MRSSPARVDALIVGGGFSGTMVAAKLARRGLSSVLLDAVGRAGKGTAYSTRDDVHLLNVPAAKMSAFVDNPHHFADAVAGEGYASDAFVPRKRFGKYLSDILSQNRADGMVSVLETSAVGATPADDGWVVELANGCAVEARALVLAQGNQPPDVLPFAKDVRSNRFVNDPWSEAGKIAVQSVAAGGGDVLLVGTGLTMVDMVLSLEEAGFAGTITALSRRGQAPQVHAPHDAKPVDFDALPRGSVSALWRWLREASADGNWRGTVDSLRPHSHRIWNALSLVERQRFLRHARPWWDVHRHRIAPQVGETIARLVREGRLEIVAGRITQMDGDDTGLDVDIRRRGQAAIERRRYAVGFNCTGPLHSIQRSSDQLLRGLLGDGLAAPDELGIGLEVEADSRVVGADRLWALGPLTKGYFWEIVAVPDIRHQVAAVADDIAKELNR